MRGTLEVRIFRGYGLGIIPAYAGNTNAFHEMLELCRDHPRVCGEHSSGIGMMRYGTGSSPRMRGTLMHHAQGFTTAGIIPAYAGNTFVGLSR